MQNYNFYLSFVRYFYVLTMKILDEGHLSNPVVFNISL